MSFIILIPARYDSTRLPGKPLLDLNGKTLIKRVYEAAKLSNASEVYIATESELILEECNSFGAKSILTNESHKTGSDRLSEAAELLSLDDDTVIVNLQGDEPFIDYRDINSVADLALEFDADMSTMYADLKQDDLKDENVVKLWVKENHDVITFSRDETKMSDKRLLPRHHLGIYAYKVSFLKDFIRLAQSKNELSENLEQLRALDNNKSIKAIKSLGIHHLGIDTQEDLIKARLLLN